MYTCSKKEYQEQLQVGRDNLIRKEHINYINYILELIENSKLNSDYLTPLK